MIGGNRDFKLMHSLKILSPRLRMTKLLPKEEWLGMLSIFCGPNIRITAKAESSNFVYTGCANKKTIP